MINLSDTKKIIRRYAWVCHSKHNSINVFDLEKKLLKNVNQIQTVLNSTCTNYRLKPWGVNLTTKPMITEVREDGVSCKLPKGTCANIGKVNMMFHASGARDRCILNGRWYCTGLWFQCTNKKYAHPHVALPSQRFDYEVCWGAFGPPKLQGDLLKDLFHCTSFLSVCGTSFLHISKFQRAPKVHGAMR